MLFVLAFCLLAGAAGSMVYAYLIDRQETVNRIKIVENKTHIEEEFDPPADPGPGSVIKKKPCIVNDSVFPWFVVSFFECGRSGKYNCFLCGFGS